MLISCCTPQIPCLELRLGFLFVLFLLLTGHVVCKWQGFSQTTRIGISRHPSCFTALLHDSHSVEPSGSLMRVVVRRLTGIFWLKTGYDPAYMIFLFRPQDTSTSTILEIFHQGSYLELKFTRVNTYSVLHANMLSLFASSFTDGASWSVLVILGLASIFASYVVFSPGQSFSPHSPKLISDQYPIFGALRYFSARWDFYRDAIAQSKTGNFSFYLGKYGVIGFSGRQARKDYFESKILSLHEG